MSERVSWAAQMNACRKENSIVVHLTFSIDTDIPLVAFTMENLSKDK